MNHFDEAFKILMKEEGYYSNDPDDPGKKTKYGISETYNPGMDIENITLDQAKEYYRKKWWEKYNYHLIIQAEIAIKVFITAVNMGPRDANMLLQNALRDCGEQIIPDGAVGKYTLSALNTVNAKWLLDRYRVLAAKSYATSVKNDKEKRKYFLGWINRALA